MKHTKNSVPFMITPLLITALLAGGLFQLAMAQSTPGESGFSDVSNDDPRKTSIRYFLDQQVFTGYPDETFQPERVLNRAEQLKVYLLLLGAQPSAEKYKNCFPDVQQEWFARFVCYAKELGVVEGYANGTFQPSKDVNKAEALKMLGILQKWNTEAPTVAPFTDVPAEAWFAPYVAFAKEHNFLGLTGATISPASGIPRANTAELMFRSLALYGLNQPFQQELVSTIQLLSLETLAEKKGTKVAAQDSQPQETQQQATTVITLSAIESASDPVRVGDSYTLTVRVQDAQGEFLENALLEAFKEPRPAVASEIISETFTVQNEGNGVYKVQVMSTVAGSNTIAIQEKESKATLLQTLNFAPQVAQELKVQEKAPATALGTKTYTLALKDQYGNTVQDGQFQAEATNGTVTMEAHTDGTVTAQLKVESYGLAQVVFTATSQGAQFQQTRVVDILPIGLGAQSSYAADAENIRLPVLFFLPKYSNQTVNIDVILQIPDGLTVNGFSPKSSVFEGDIDQTRSGEMTVIHITGRILAGRTFDEKIGDMVLAKVPQGTFTLEGGVTLTAENPLILGELYRPGGSTKMNEEMELTVLLPHPLVTITGS